MQLHSAVKYPCSPLITLDFFFASMSSMNDIYVATSTCRSIQSCHTIGIGDVIQILVILFSENSSPGTSYFEVPLFVMEKLFQASGVVLDVPSLAFIWRHFPTTAEKFENSNQNAEEACVLNMFQVQRTLL
jgi:hypothetical protein